MYIQYYFYSARYVNSDMESYHVFVKTLISHASNDANTSINMVNMTYDTWKKSYEEEQSGLSMLHDEYITDHEGPRNDLNLEAALYSEEQNTNKGEWNATKTSAALRKFVATTPSSKLLNSDKSSIYTQFHHPNSYRR